MTEWRLMEVVTWQSPSAGKWQSWSTNHGCLALKSMRLMTAQYCNIWKELIRIFWQKAFFLKVQKPKDELTLVSLHTNVCMSASRAPSQSPESQGQARYRLSISSLPEAQARHRQGTAGEWPASRALVLSSPINHGIALWGFFHTHSSYGSANTWWRIHMFP